MQIELRDLQKRFGPGPAVDAVNLVIAPGSMVAVLGENGAGKSTLLRLLAGVCVPDQGQVCYDGDVFTRGRLDLRRRLLFTPDTPLLFQDQTVARNLAAFSAIYGISLEEREAELAAWMEGTGAAPLIRRTAGKLSRGQVWKVALAIAATVKPELWLVDEPFASGMDAAGLAAFRKLARWLTAEGGTVVFTTQIVELAVESADWVCVLREGRAVVWDRAEKLRERLGQAGEDGAERLLSDSGQLTGS
jgi:ABC-type multidrug transport system ATPase subunit